MATITLRMQALGLIIPGAAETCAGCGREFSRGEQMSAVDADDGEPMGWYCGDCVQRWKKNGETPQPDRAEAETTD